MVVYEKIYFKAYTNDLYISHKNNIAQLYFILGKAECLPYSQIFQQEVGLNHVQYWKSVNIRSIPKSTGKVPT